MKVPLLDLKSKGLYYLRLRFPNAKRRFSHDAASCLKDAKTWRSQFLVVTVSGTIDFFLITIL